MIFHLPIFFFSLAFLAMISFLAHGTIVPSWSWFSITLSVFTVLSLFSARRITGKWYPAFLPITVSLSSLLLLSLIDSVIGQRMLVVATTILFYSSLLGSYRLKIRSTDETARAFLNAVALASLFFFYAASYGLYINYEVPSSLLLSVTFLFTVVVSFQTLFWAGRDESRLVLLIALALGMIMAETMWILDFAPFGHLTVGAIVLLVFYFLWRPVLDILRGLIDTRRFFQESIIILFFLLLLILSSPWYIRV